MKWFMLTVFTKEQRVTGIAHIGGQAGFAQSSFLYFTNTRGIASVSAVVGLRCRELLRVEQ